MQVCLPDAAAVAPADPAPALFAATAGGAAPAPALFAAAAGGSATALFAAAVGAAAPDDTPPGLGFKRCSA